MIRSRDFNKLTQHFKPFQSSHLQLCLHQQKLEKTLVIQPNTFVGNNVVIGDRIASFIQTLVFMMTPVIGNNVTIHSGTVY